MQRENPSVAYTLDLLPGYSRPWGRNLDIFRVDTLMEVEEKEKQNTGHFKTKIVGTNTKEVDKFSNPSFWEIIYFIVFKDSKCQKIITSINELQNSNSVWFLKVKIPFM